MRAQSCCRLENKKIQHGWQTSALAMHLPLARLFFISVIFCLLPSSSIVFLVLYLFFYRHHWTARVRTVSVNTVHWFDACFSGTPVINSMTLLSPVQSLGYIYCRWQYIRSSANFRTVFSESQNANPLDAEPETHFNARWPFKIIQGHLFGCQWRITKRLHSTI